jgi:hypothetical protein
MKMMSCSSDQTIHTQTYAHARARARAHTHTHTHTESCQHCELRKGVEIRECEVHISCSI